MGFAEVVELRGQGRITEGAEGATSRKGRKNVGGGIYTTHPPGVPTP